MKTKRMKSIIALVLASIALATGAANAAVTLALGSGTNRLGTTTFASTTGISQSSNFASGTFTTANPSGVSFTLQSSGTNGDPNAQPTAWGVSGGSVTLGIDNSGGILEAITFTISGVTGLAPGESLVFRSATLVFGADTAGESYRLNGSGNIAFTSNADSINLSDATSFTVGAGSAGNTRFGVGGLTVEVIPEPSSALLCSLGFLALLRRRR